MKIRGGSSSVGVEYNKKIYTRMSIVFPDESNVVEKTIWIHDFGKPVSKYLYKKLEATYSSFEKTVWDSKVHGSKKRSFFGMSGMIGPFGMGPGMMR